MGHRGQAPTATMWNTYLLSRTRLHFPRRHREGINLIFLTVQGIVGSPQVCPEQSHQICFVPERVPRICLGLFTCRALWEADKSQSVPPGSPRKRSPQGWQGFVMDQLITRFILRTALSAPWTEEAMDTFLLFS